MSADENPKFFPTPGGFNGHLSGAGSLASWVSVGQGEGYRAPYPEASPNTTQEAVPDSAGRCSGRLEHLLLSTLGTVTIPLSSPRKLSLGDLGLSPIPTLPPSQSLVPSPSPKAKSYSCLFLKYAFETNEPIFSIPGLGYGLFRAFVVFHELQMPL